jgi:adenosylmethionine-8-amino-7-oxononanoate aminotransferase
MSEINTGYLFYQNRKKLPIIDRAEGVWMWDRDGKAYIDGCSGAIVSNIGYGNPRILEAMQRQASKTFFAYRTQFENEPACRLAETLVSLSAAHLTKVFFVSGGSEAVESTIKLCRQYFYNRGEGSRYIFISREPSYHGCTLGALSLSSYAPLEAPFRPLLMGFPKIPAPYCYRCAYHKTYPSCGLACAWALDETILRVGPLNVAAFIAEPIGGATTGALVPPDGYFDVIQEVCRRHGVLLILDEVMTGFGRTGKLFAYEHWGVEADVVALSKGMSAGYFPLGAMLSRTSIVEEVISKGGFPHGFTYAGNPMACTVGLEVLKVITEMNLPDNAERMGRLLKSGLEALAERNPVIGQVRGKGLLLAIELVADRDTREPFPADSQAALTLTDRAFEEGLIVYPRRSIHGLAGDHVLIAPPLIVTESQCQEILHRLEKALWQTQKDLKDNPK